MRTGLIILLVLGLALAAATLGASPDDSIGLVVDSSENGLHLTPVGDIVFAESSGAYLKGYEVDGNDDFFYRNASQFALFGNLSLFLRYQAKNLPAGGTNVTLEVLGRNGTSATPDAQRTQPFVLALLPGTNRVFYRHSYAYSPLRSFSFSSPVGSFPIDENEHSITLRRINAERRLIITFDNVEKVNTTWPVGQDPTPIPKHSNTLSVAATFSGFEIGTGEFRGIIREVRIWPNALSSTTLAKIANATDATYKQVVEGSETAVYFMEWEGNRCLLCARPSPSVLRTFLEQGGVALLFVAIGSLVAMKLGVIPLGRTKN